MADDHEIRVTLRDVYDIQQTQTKTMAEVNAKLDLYIGLNANKEDKIKDHESRIRVMERWVFAIPGISVIIAIAGLVIAVLKK